MRKEGNIPVDIELDESGITPDQVISYSYYIKYPVREDENIVFTLFYKDSNGQKQLASCGFGHFQKKGDNAKNFHDSFLNWLNHK